MVFVLVPLDSNRERPLHTHTLTHTLSLSPTHTHTHTLNQMLFLILFVDGTYLGMWKIDDFMTTIIR